MTYSINNTTQITNQQVMDLLIGAFEGGSNYWAGKIADRYPSGPLTPEKLVFWAKPEFFATEGWWIDIETDEDGPADYRLDAERVQRALQHLADECPDTWANILLDGGDAYTSDTFLQLAVLGEERYG